MTRIVRWTISVIFVVGLLLTVFAVLEGGDSPLVADIFRLVGGYVLLMGRTYLHDWFYPPPIKERKPKHREPRL